MNRVLVLLLLLISGLDVCAFVGYAGLSMTRKPSQRASFQRPLICKLSSSESSEKTVSQAIQRCKDAVTKDPQNEKAWFLLGVLLQVKKTRCIVAFSHYQCIQFGQIRRTSVHIKSVLP